MTLFISFDAIKFFSLISFIKIFKLFIFENGKFTVFDKKFYSSI